MKKIHYYYFDFENCWLELRSKIALLGLRVNNNGWQD